MLLAIGGVGVAAYLAMKGKSSNQKTIGGDSGGGGEEPQPEEVVFGCTNIYATNYDPIATNDDGSCMYDVPLVDNSLLYTEGVGGVYEAYPFVWYFVQAVGMDPYQLEPCNALVSSLPMFDEQYSVGAQGLLNMLAFLPPPDSDVQLTGDQLNALAYEAMVAGSDGAYQGPVPQIFDNATGQPNVNWIPWPESEVDCSVISQMLFTTYADFRLYVETWTINTGGDAGESGPFNPPVSSLITDISDPCTLVGWMDTTILPQVMAGGEPVNAYQLGYYLAGELLAQGVNWGVASPFNEDGSYVIPYNEVENIPLPNCTAPDDEEDDTSGGGNTGPNTDFENELNEDDTATGGGQGGGGPVGGIDDPIMVGRNMYSNLG